MDYPKSIPGVGLVNGGFVYENSIAGSPGSLIPAAWGNSVTQEILNAIKAAGLTPDEARTDQVATAIGALVDFTKLKNTPTTLAGYGITDAVGRLLAIRQIEIGVPVGELRQEIAPLPVTSSRVITPETVPDEQEPLAAARLWRQSSLSATEWWVTRHRDEQELGRGTTLKAAQYLELLEYRQALRDWPGSSLFPSTVSQPLVPTWLVALIG